MPFVADMAIDGNRGLEKKILTYEKPVALSTAQ
jgi:hypothetical protein